MHTVSLPCGLYGGKSTWLFHQSFSCTLNTQKASLLYGFSGEQQDFLSYRIAFHTRKIHTVFPQCGPSDACSIWPFQWSVFCTRGSSTASAGLSDAQGGFPSLGNFSCSQDTKKISLPCGVSSVFLFFRNAVCIQNILKPSLLCGFSDVQGDYLFVGSFFRKRCTSRVLILYGSSGALQAGIGSETSLYPGYKCLLSVSWGEHLLKVLMGSSSLAAPYHLLWASSIAGSPYHLHHCRSEASQIYSQETFPKRCQVQPCWDIPLKTLLLELQCCPIICGEQERITCPRTGLIQASRI